MKKIILLSVWLLNALIGLTQVGIGTLSPNTKSLLDLSSSTQGLLLPRMTQADRTTMSLTAADAGMMVYQTTSPKGLFTWDGTSWIYYAPLDAGSATATTLRWDNTTSRWIAASNIFNGGGSIGINTGIAPNYQLHVSSSNGPLYTRFQISNTGTGNSQFDGLVLGIGASSNNGVAHLLQQENKPLWFGTNGIERMRIDSAGNVGINTASPSAYLDVNGSFKLGTFGTSLHSIMHADVVIDPPMMQYGEEWTASISCPNTTADAVIYASPGAVLNHMMIEYARVSTPGTVEIKFMSMTYDNDMGPVTFHIAVIQ